MDFFDLTFSLETKPESKSFGLVISILTFLVKSYDMKTAQNRLLINSLVD